MKKRKTYEVSVINKTHSKTYSDETKFYTSDTALELNFQLKEVEYDFDSAEIILLNVDDRSLATRPVVKSVEGFTYELEDDIVEHYGEWKGQLKFNEGGEIYVSSPVVFRIHNDLYNDRPPQVTEVNTWKNLRKIADGLISDIRSELESVAELLPEIESAESERQSAELTRVENENQRNLTSVEEFAKLQDTIGGRNLLLNSDIGTASLSTFDKTNYPQVRFKPNEGVMTSGIKLRDGIFKVGEQYTISFTIQNQEGAGEIYSLGGHDAGFKVVSVSVDGEVQDTNWSGGTLKYGFGYSEHEIIIKVIATGTSADKNFYIQPNRGGTVFNMYDVILNNIKVEKGTQPTPYTKAPEDYTTVTKDDYYNHVKLMSELTRSEVRGKANKKQEDWITLPLYNGAQHGDSPLKVMKDEMGVVHFKGSLTNLVSGSKVFGVPSGYGPDIGITELRIRVPVALNTSRGTNILQINYAGDGYIANSSNTEIAYFDGVSYLAKRG